MTFFTYILNNTSKIIDLFLEHIYLTTIAILLAIIVGVPLGILISDSPQIKKPTIGIANIIQAIPSMALLGFMIPFLGIGQVPAIVVVFFYSLLPIIKNTNTGILNINPQIIEAANGIGLTKMQVLYKIEIPLALPVIMAGIRVAAVTAVGLMTIAAFIGAGGLGYLVFLGIRTVNTSQILAGAIPACILALLVDFTLGMLENLVTPISLQKGNLKKLKKVRFLKKIALFIILIFFSSVFFFRFYKTDSKNDKILVIGSKDYTEQTILSNLAAIYIENNTDITIDRKFDLGGTKIIFPALKNGDIDMYFEYTGSAYADTLAYEPISDINEVYKVVKNDFKNKFNIEVLNLTKFNNTYTLAIRKDTAEKYKLKTISDLAKVAQNLTFGTTFVFTNRKDGLPGLEKKYNFKAKSVITLDGSPRYIALNNLDVDVIDAFSTDGLLKKFELVILEDNLKFFPPYYVAPIVRTEVLEKFPEIVPLLDKLVNLLTDEVMIDLNYSVDELQKSPEEVAREFLEKQNLISKKISD